MCDGTAGFIYPTSSDAIGFKKQFERDRKEVIYWLRVGPYSEKL